MISRTSNGVDMKLEPVTKLKKGNTAMSKKFDNDVLSTNHQVIVIFPIYVPSGAIRKLNSP